LQLPMCNQYNFYQKNYNSTSTPVATRQALKMQLFRALKLQLKKLSSSDYYNKTIATCRVLENHSLGENLWKLIICNSECTSIATQTTIWLQLKG
jgi:hypothetical protein